MRRLTGGFAGGILALFGSFALAPQARAGNQGRVVCSNHICVVIVQEGNADKSPGTRGAAKQCAHSKQIVPCQTLDGAYNAEDGCYYRPVDATNASGPVRKEYDEAGGSILFASCPFGGAGGFLWRPPAKPVVTAAMVRARAIRLIPTAALGLAPKTATLVNIQTVMWVDAPAEQNLTAVQILGQRVVIRLQSATVHYDFGDGASADGPIGKRYDETRDPCKSRLCPDYFGHVYTERGVRTVAATAYWHVSFTVDGGASQQVVGTVPGPTSRAQVTVREARAVLVPAP